MAEDFGLDPQSYILTGRRAAPEGKFRVLGFDSFSRDDFKIDFNDEGDAIRFAKKRAADMLRMYVYNSAGELVFSC